MSSYDSAAAKGAADAASGRPPASLPPATPAPLREAYEAAYDKAKKSGS